MSFDIIQPFDHRNYVFEPGQHNGKEVIWISFPSNQNLVLYLKNNTKAFWSQSNKK